MIKNDGAILRTNIRPLPIASGRVVITPKNIEQVLVAHLRGIEFDFDHFRMTGVMAANLFVGRVFRRAARISARGRNHTLGITKQFFNTPKTSRAEQRLFDTHTRTIKRERLACNRSPVAVSLCAT